MTPLPTNRRVEIGGTLIASDYDPSGEDLADDFIHRTDCWQDWNRLALTAEQVREHHLPPAPAKPGDPRAEGFAEREGAAVQVELDALPPAVLADLYRTEIDGWWNPDAHAEALAASSDLAARVRDLAGAEARRRTPWRTPAQKPARRKP